jgi:hypothetical protein
MSVYSTNQARHLYVVNSIIGTEAGSLTEINEDTDKNIFFKFINAEGEPIRSDLISNIISAKATKASAMARNLNAVKIVTNGTPEVGKAYTIVITYRQWVAASDEVFYHELASVKATTTVASDLYKALALQLAKNTAKQGLVEIGLYDGSTTTKVTTSTGAATLTGTYTELYIIEKEQKWVLGTTPQTQVFIDKDAIKCEWGTVTPITLSGSNATIKNGKEMADLEYFCLGERGDIYRNINWPYVTPTKGLVDYTKEYDVIDIHYSYIGGNEGAQKSEKTITLAVLNDGTGKYSETTLVNQVITAINMIAGSSIIESLK